MYCTALHRIILKSTFATMTLCCAHALAADSPHFALEPLWSADGMELAKSSISPDGRLATIAWQKREWPHTQILLLDATKSSASINMDSIRIEGAGGWLKYWVSTIADYFSAKPLKLYPDIYDISAGPSGQTWLGGAVNTEERPGEPRSHLTHSDAYVALIDDNGKLVWERAYGNGGIRTIKVMSSLPSGDLIVGGNDGWLARIAADGHLIWEKTVEGYIYMIAPLPDNRFVAVGPYSQVGRHQNHNSNICVRIFDASGNEVTSTTVGLPVRYDDYPNYTQLAVGRDAIYVGSFRSWPIRMSKLGLDGTIQWQSDIGDVAGSHDAKQRLCYVQYYTAIAANAAGGVTAACQLDDGIHVYDLDAATGQYIESTLPLPGCSDGHFSLIRARDDGSMVLGTTTSAADNATHCAWLGRLTKVH